MFTGIIEETGTVGSIVSAGSYGELMINASVVLENTKLGDSIAVNGVCLTVTKLLTGGFTADVMPETLRRSSLGKLKKGDKVNLERAMSAEGRFGGHIVSGHIDGTGTIIGMKRENNAVWVEISAHRSILSLIVEKGSIAIDGISRTMFTTRYKVGDIVNLENDIIGKYVQRLMQAQTETKSENRITEDFLAQHGFM